MLILTFLTQVVGAVLLLLYAVRMVRTGVERAFGASFRHAVTASDGPIRAAGTGIFLAVILQSSTAVALLVASFAEVGALAFPTALAVMLGADLGGALLTQVLSLKLDWLIPALLAIGGGVFLNSDRRVPKQAGRIILGAALILISLGFLREAIAPIKESRFLPAMAGFLEDDYGSAFLIGAALAFVMHSSVAAILTCVTLVATGALPMIAGASLALGANLGSALISIWLTRGMAPAARRAPLANLAIRGGGAVIALVVVNQFPIPHHIAGATDAQTIINLHIGLNLTLLLAALPLRRLLQRPLERMTPDRKSTHLETSVEHISVLREADLETPHLALAGLTREVMRMTQLVRTMASPTMRLFNEADADLALEIAAEDDFVDRALDGVRRYVAEVPTERMDAEDGAHVREMAEYAIALESAADIIVRRLIPLAKKKVGRGIRFSDQGREELSEMHDRLVANIDLAANVLVSGDLTSARSLVEEKTEMSRMERESREKHLERLGEGAAVSFDSSNIHLETLRAIKDMNSLIAGVAYPSLQKSGQLLETRLVADVKS